MVPVVAVVRVPVPRLEVQPGRREEGRPGAAWARPLRARGPGGSMTSTPATSLVGPPIGTNTTGQRAEGAPCVVRSTRRSNLRLVIILVNLAACSRPSGSSSCGGCSACAGTRGRARPRTSRRSSRRGARGPRARAGCSGSAPHDGAHRGRRSSPTTSSSRPARPTPRSSSRTSRSSGARSCSRTTRARPTTPLGVAVRELPWRRRLGRQHELHDQVG